MLGFQQRLASFVFCKSSQKRMLGVIWSNEERIKMVLESTNPLECMRSIFSLNKITALLEVFWKDWFSQTNFTPLQKLYLDWKKSKRVSETISKEESKDSRLQWATGWCAAGLIWNWWQYSIWWLTSRFWKKKQLKVLLIMHLRPMTLILLQKLSLKDWNIQLRS